MTISFPLFSSFSLRKRPESRPVDFSNDMSRIVRGIAVVMMVVGHSLPGKIIPFAVPLFSFLVGYGYAFAKQRSLRHAGRRIWHLLSHFWFILFAVCLPAALISWDGVISLPEIGLNMFGLAARFNFYCWYVYFYIAAMLMMPLLTRWIDRRGLAAMLAEAAFFGLVAGAIWLFFGKWLTTGHTNPVTVIYRVSRYMPVVVSAYWLARHRVLSRIRLPRHPLTAIGCLLLLAALYLLRGLPYAICADLIAAPVAALLVAAIFNLYALAPLRFVLTELGLKSMGIWFLHALFFTHSTRGLFRPLIDWIPADNWLGHTPWLADKALQVVAILILSYAMAAMTDFLFGRFRRLLDRLPRDLRKMAHLLHLTHSANRIA